MPNVKLISSLTCTKCHFIKGPLKSWAESKWYEFEEKDISEATPEEVGDATSLPIIIIDGVRWDYDNILQKITQ